MSLWFYSSYDYNDSTIKMKDFIEIGHLQGLFASLAEYKDRKDIRSIADIPNEKDRARAEKIIQMISEVGERIHENGDRASCKEAYDKFANIVRHQIKMPYMEGELQPGKDDFYDHARYILRGALMYSDEDLQNTNFRAFADMHKINGGNTWKGESVFFNNPARPFDIIEGKNVTPQTALYVADKLNIKPEELLYDNISETDNILSETETKKQGIVEYQGQYYKPSDARLYRQEHENLIECECHNICLQKIKEGRINTSNIFGYYKYGRYPAYEMIAKDKKLSSDYLQAIADACDKYAKNKIPEFYDLMKITSHIAKENPEQIDKVTEIIDKSFNDEKKVIRKRSYDGMEAELAIKTITESMIEIAENKNLSDKIRQKAQKNALKTLSNYAYMDIENCDLDSIQESRKQLSEKILKSPAFSEEDKKFVTINMEKVNKLTAEFDNINLLKSGRYDECMTRIKNGKATTPNLGYGWKTEAEKIAKQDIQDIVSSAFIHTVADNCDKYLDTYEHSLVFENMVNLSAQIAKENPNQVKNLAKVLDKTNSLVTKIKPETEKPYQYAVTTIADAMVKVAENKELPETTRQDAQKNAVSAIRNISNIYGLSDRREYKELTNKILQSPDFSDENKQLVANAYKNSRKDYDFVKEFVANKKKEIQKRLAERRENSSGVVAADKIAEAKRNGSLKDTITPEKGKLLASFINSQANQK